MAFLGPNSPIPEKGKGTKLTQKMIAFIDEYMVSGVVKSAVLAAGYKTNNPTLIGTRLINHPLVSAEIEKRRSERQEKMEISADYLLHKLINIIDNDQIKTQDQLRAIELAGKSIALWKERQEVSGPDGEAIKMEQKIQEDVSDFTARIAKLRQSKPITSPDSRESAVGGAGTVVKFAKP